MKKNFLLAMILSMAALPFTACGSDDPKTPDSTDTTTGSGESTDSGSSEETESTTTTEEPDLFPYRDPKAPMVGLGWNLGNQFDAYNNGVAQETAWGNPATTQKLFTKLSVDGFKTVRIPITWLGHVGAAPDYKIDETWLNRVYEVVGYAQSAGLNAIINIHHDGADSSNWLDIKTAANDEDANTRIKERLAAMWTQIAEKFIDKGDFLIFEPFNEIHDGGWGWGDNRSDGGRQYAVLNEWNQTFVDAVRATGGKNATRWLSAVGYVTNPDLTMDYLQIPNDSADGRMLVAVHFYDPTTFTLEGSKTEWGHTGTDKESWGNEDNMTTVFSKLKSKFVDNGYPVYIGEAGCIHHTTARSELFRKYYMEYLMKSARDNELGVIIWDNGSTGAGRECHGYYNHATGEYINNAEEIIHAANKGYYNTDSEYTLQTVWDKAPE